MNTFLFQFHQVALIAWLGIGAINAHADDINRQTLLEQYPPLGRMVDIGGRRLQLDCRGTGSPTVVFEAGLDDLGSLSWTLVHDEIAQVTRACAYSRAGIMWSDQNDGPQTGKAVAEDLHALLTQAGEQAPFVLVGHSLGGPYSMTFTKFFGADVAGLVMVDASHPDQEALLNPLYHSSQVQSPAPFSIKPKSKLQSATALNDEQIAQLVQAHAAYLAGSKLAEAKEYAALSATLVEAGTLRQLAQRPMFVLTAAAPLSAELLAAEGITAEQDQKRLVIWKQLQADMAKWSSNSQQQYVADSTHYIQFNRPDLVIAAVLSVVDSVRTGQAPTPVTYDEQTQKLTLRDVLVDGSHYQAVLRHKAGYFVLDDFSAASTLFNEAARYDSDRKLLTIPLAEVAGKHYQATFHYRADGVFTLDTLAPL